MVGLTVISLFAGCGGSSLGYKMAGFREFLAVEWDDNAVETFRLNFPEVPIYHGDIKGLSSDECMRLTGVGRGELDVLDGSPPCQGFSTAGKRKFNDPRNSLFKEYARLLSELQPRVFVMENVTGMIKGCMKQAYLQIIKTLRECGYKAKGEVLNAMYFNVPQSRERVIIIGVREDLGIEPSHPKPQGKPITIREAWKGCDEPTGKMIRGREAKIAKVIKPGETNGQGKCGKRIGEGIYGFGMSRLHWDKPSFTITKLDRAPMLHPDADVRLTSRQCSRIASFPDNFIWSSNATEARAKIGNSVPPNLMKAIAEHVRKEILEKANGHDFEEQKIRVDVPDQGQGHRAGEDHEDLACRTQF